MKHTIKWITLTLLLATGVGLHAQTIDLHLECAPGGQDCVELKDDHGEAFQVQAKPGFQITEANVADVWEAIDEFGQIQLRMDLKPEAAESFGELTGANINKVLAIVYDGRVITAPMIKDRISGSITLSQGTDNTRGDRVWQKIPWIKERVNRTEAQDRTKKQLRIAIYVTLALVLLVGGLAFAFRRVKPARRS